MKAFESKALAVVLICLAWALSPEAQAGSLERFVMPGPVSAVHAGFEDDCARCHSPLENESQATLCVACHTDVGDDLQTGNGLHGKHPQVANNECQLCHAEHEGRDATTLDFDWEEFDHALTDFPLLWAHGALGCEACHRESEPFGNTPDTCNGCHSTDDPHQGGLGNACGDCHTQRSWQTTSFDHQLTKFPLTGAHAPVVCSACHENAAFSDVSTQCVACHESDDAHDGRFGTQCQGCHTTSDWTTALFDHAATTGFSLTAGHGGLNCEACHSPSRSGKLQGSTCHSCHADEDIHQGNNGTSCADCHGTVNWRSTSFNHLLETGFRLSGAHAAAQCTSCHVGALKDFLPTTCGDCHIDEDPHSSQLGGNCSSCHNETAWHAGVRFDHDFSVFPLVGQHAALECSACHKSKAFHDAGSACADCHSDPHQDALGPECQACHNPSGWSFTTFDHQADTGFPLEAAHQALECVACHLKPVLLEASGGEDCEQCHRQDDPHQKRFGTDCGRCHSTTSFTRVERF